MHKLILVSLLVLSITIMEVTCNDAMLSPPGRPKNFRTPAELRQYLKELNEYYAIVGRPRFGKRNGERRNSDFGRLDGEGFTDDVLAQGDYF